MQNTHFTVSGVIRWTFKTLYEKAPLFLGVGSILFGFGLLSTFLITYISSAVANAQVAGSAQQLSPMHVVSTLVSLLYMVVDSYLTLGFLRIVLDIYDTGMAHIATLFSQARLILRHILGGLIIGLLSFSVAFVCVLPLLYLLFRLFLLVPGEFVDRVRSLDIYTLMTIGMGISSVIAFGYFVSRYFFFNCLIVDRNLGISDALSKSAQLTKGVRLKIIGLLLVLAIPAVPLIIGRGKLDAIPALSMIFSVVILLIRYLVMLLMVYAYRKQQENTL